jgi:hypothetical protein
MTACFARSPTPMRPRREQDAAYVHRVAGVIEATTIREVLDGERTPPRSEVVTSVAFAGARPLYVVAGSEDRPDGDEVT